MNKKNNFQELEGLMVKKHGKVPKEVQDNIENNLIFFKTIGHTIDLFTEKFIKTFIKMNG